MGLIFFFYFVNDIISSVCEHTRFIIAGDLFNYTFEKFPRLSGAREFRCSKNETNRPRKPCFFINNIKTVEGKKTTTFGELTFFNTFNVFPQKVAITYTRTHTHTRVRMYTRSARAFNPYFYTNIFLSPLPHLTRAASLDIIYIFPRPCFPADMTKRKWDYPKNGGFAGEIPQ